MDYSGSVSSAKGWEVVGKKEKKKTEERPSGKTISKQTLPQGVFSLMSIQFTQGKIQGQERKEVLQEVQKRVKSEALRAIKPVLTAFWKLNKRPSWDERKGNPDEKAQSRERSIGSVGMVGVGTPINLHVMGITAGV